MEGWESALIKITSVSRDEKALWLMETNTTVLVNGHTQMHRIMVIRVMRDQTECEYIEDLGDSDTYRDQGFVIPGFGFESVGHLIDLAESERDMKPFHIRVGLEMPNIPNAWRETKEEVWKRARGISVFGPEFKKQRNA